MTRFFPLGEDTFKQIKQNMENSGSAVINNNLCSNNQNHHHHHHHHHHNHNHIQKKELNNNSVDSSDIENYKSSSTNDQYKFNDSFSY